MDPRAYIPLLSRLGGQGRQPTIPGLDAANFSGPMDPEKESRTFSRGTQTTGGESARQTRAMDPNMWRQALETTRKNMPPSHREYRDDVDMAREAIKGLVGIEANRSLMGGVDLSPLVALTDSWTGSNLLAGYGGSPTDQNIALGMQLAPMIAQAENQLSKNELDALKMNLADYWAQELGVKEDAGAQYREGVSQGLGALGPLITDARAREHFAIQQQNRAEDLAREAAKPNTFQESKARHFAASAVEWANKDRPQLLSNLEKLDHAVGILASDQDVSGAVRGRLPDVVRAYTHPNALIARDNVRSAIVDTLRPTLGAQFTQVEGERIQNLAFDASLPQQENLRRARALREVMARKIAMSDALYAHLEANGGSDAGFDYGRWGMEKTVTSGTTPQKDVNEMTEEEIDAELRSLGGN